MFFPLTLSDISLLLAVIAIILLITSELLYSMPNLSGRIALDKDFLRTVALGCGIAFLLTVILRVMGMLS
jgi:hypothetical protein